MNVAPNRGFSRSDNLPVWLEFTSDRPRLPWQRRFGNFGGKMAKTQLIQEIVPQKLHQMGVLKVTQFTVITEIYIRPTPAAMATKIWEFWRKNGKNSPNTRNRATNVAPNREFSKSSNLLVSLAFTSDRPRFPWQRKCEKFNTKLAIMAQNLAPNTFSG